MIINFYPYNFPTYEDTCVALCFFRPIEYKNPLKNLNIVLEDLKNSQIPYFSIELLYKNQQNAIKDPTITVYSSSVIFSKENLWNIIEKEIPKKYKKIIFIDADIRFTNTDWFNKTSELLNIYDVIQPMDFCYRDIHNDSSSIYNIDENSLRPSIAKGISNKETIDISKHYPGFSIAIKRDFYKNIGGFFEYGLNGFGDSLFWSSFCNVQCKYTKLAEKLFPEYTTYKKNIISQITKNTVGYLNNSKALHLYHGSLKNRKYNLRENYIPEKFSISRNNYGVLEIDYQDTDKLIFQYWLDRKEDE